MSALAWLGLTCADSMDVQIERRLAPFWKGLNEVNSSWAEHQFVAAVRGLPIPAADEPPADMVTPVNTSPTDQTPTEAAVDRLTIPITGRTASSQSDLSSNLSASHPAFSGMGALSSSTPPSSLNLFRGRAKTFASLTSGSRSDSTTQLAAQEFQLPKDPNVNGQPVEVYLYKDAQECPICFLYYPPYLNKTRCCDQPICSECFVQIKRPDPHVPEHHDDPSNPNPEPKPEEEVNLVSEPSACPFCVTPEFGVTYEPPPFRRGLAYANNGSQVALGTSAMSSSTSLGSMGSRRRTTSLSVHDKAVITTDKIRPDWAKKLADARAHALRRSAAATALHNAAYVLGNTQNLDLRAFSLGRRRRAMLGEGSSASPGGPEGSSALSVLLGRPDGQGGQAEGEEGPQRGAGGRRSRADDIEELMMMEAIRLSLAAEEERKKKEEKEAAKEAKKKAKDDAKQAKKLEKAAKKGSKPGSLYNASANQSTSTWASTSMTRSTSNLGQASLGNSPPGSGKGKGPAHGSLGFSPLDEPTSTLNRDTKSGGEGGRNTENAQRHLEESRANLPQASQPIALSPDSIVNRGGHSRHFSNASSVASSMLDSTAGSSYRTDTNFGTPPLAAGAMELAASDNDESQPETPSAAGQTTPGALEPLFNFRSLAAMIGEEDRWEGDGNGNHATNDEKRGLRQTSVEAKGVVDTAGGGGEVEDGHRARGDSGGSSSSGGPQVEALTPPNTTGQEHLGAGGEKKLVVGEPRIVERADLGRQVTQ